MKKAILNAWPSVAVSPEGEWQSRITLELTALPEKIQFEAVSSRTGTAAEHRPQEVSARATANALSNPATVLAQACTYRFTLHGIELVMAADDILVSDGLMKLVRVYARGHPGGRVSPEDPPQVNIDVLLEYPLCEQSECNESGYHQSTTSLPVEIHQTPGLPATVTLCFSRKPLQNLFKGFRIGIDPGHGGKDKGIEGPVDLAEKYVALEISRELCPLLKLSGAHPIVTRTSDVYLTEESRLDILRAGDPALCIQIHASGSHDHLAQTYTVAAAQDCADSRLLASEITAALLERMGIKAEPTSMLPGPSGLGVPIVRVEPLCLTYFADEANFRAPLFRKRLGQSIYNGIARYLYKRRNAAILHRSCEE